MNEEQQNETPQEDVLGTPRLRGEGSLEELWAEVVRLRTDTHEQLDALDSGLQLIRSQMDHFREECRTLLNEPVQDADPKEDLKRLYYSLKVTLAGMIPQPIREKIHSLQQAFESQWVSCPLCGGLKDIGTGKEPVVCPECQGGGKVRKNQPYSYFGPFDASAWNWRDGLFSVIRHRRFRKN